MSKELAAFAAHARRMAEATPDTRLHLHVQGFKHARMKVGAISDAERDLWRRLADEAERFLGSEDNGDRTPAPDDVPLAF